MAVHEITSPIPGTFYTRQSPADPPFIAIGDTVAVGDAVGLVEVMKLFNPIQSTVAGTVLSIAESEEIVSPGDVLVRIEVS